MSSSNLSTKIRQRYDNKLKITDFLCELCSVDQTKKFEIPDSRHFIYSVYKFYLYKSLFSVCILRSFSFLSFVLWLHRKTLQRILLSSLQTKFLFFREINGFAYETAEKENGWIYSIIWLYRTRLYRNSVFIEVQLTVPPDTMLINTRDGYIETRIYWSIYHGPLNFDITGLYLYKTKTKPRFLGAMNMYAGLTTASPRWHLIIRCNVMK